MSQLLPRNFILGDWRPLDSLWHDPGTVKPSKIISRRYLSLASALQFYNKYPKNNKKLDIQEYFVIITNAYGNFKVTIQSVNKTLFKIMLFMTINT